MFTHDGVILAALYLEEPNLILALSFWPHQAEARQHFKGAFEVSLYGSDNPDSRVRMEVQLDAVTVEELFMAAELINAHPTRPSARRAEKHFNEFLAASFPDSIAAWVKGHRWREEPGIAESGTPVRVG
jgi:hypothetical protein